MTTQIKFGTSGWRAVMAEEFTFANVHRAVHGIARYVSSQKSSGAKVIVGRDPRFLGETFCSMAAEILASYGISPLVIAEPVPTPAISYAVIQSKADGAINFTASHNPPEYNGIKFSTPDGAPSLPEVTKAIEAEIAGFDANPETPRGNKTARAHAGQRRVRRSGRHRRRTRCARQGGRRAGRRAGASRPSRWGHLPAPLRARKAVHKPRETQYRAKLLPGPRESRCRPFPREIAPRRWP